MATRFRCLENAENRNKNLKQILSTPQCKNHFINLTKKDNVLVSYLLKYSKKVNDDTYNSDP